MQKSGSGGAVTDISWNRRRGMPCLAFLLKIGSSLVVQGHQNNQATQKGRFVVLVRGAGLEPARLVATAF